MIMGFREEWRVDGMTCVLQVKRNDVQRKYNKAKKNKMSLIEVIQLTG